MASQKIIQSDCLDGLRTLADGSIHCCVTSPPYWGLRDYGRDGQIGLEATPEAYVERLVEVFREVRRVLRDDGTCWLNLGDSYGSGKQLVGIPWRVAFALQSDGWYLRQDIIWHKPNPMPESVRDRCAKAHEYVFLLTKSGRYFYDCDAIREPWTGEAAKAVSVGTKTVGARGVSDSSRRSLPEGTSTQFSKKGHSGYFGSDGKCLLNPLGAKKRSVWRISTRSYKGAHFATMPPQLAETCLRAGTSEAGCCSLCGTPHERVVERKRVATRPGTDTKVTGDKMTDGNRDPERHVTTITTTGWRPTCSCNASASPCNVLDPFGGSGTTLAVAAELGLNGIGFELNDDYIGLAEERIAKSRDKAPLFIGPPCPSGAAIIGTVGSQAGVG
jgi:site-specific DNA-methyltransferase (adenine-specific)